MIKAIIHRDTDCASPRENDKLGTLCIFHRRYDFPNESKMPSAMLREYLACKDFKGVQLPVFMYDHSGLAFNTSGFSCPWDSGQVGVIYAERAKLDAWFEGGPYDDAAVSDILRDEVAIFGAWTEGECYGYVLIGTEPGECEDDALWGIIGRDAVEEAAREAGAEVIEYAPEV